MPKITFNLVERSVSFINAINDRELDMRDNKIPAIENLGATKDQNDVLDLTNNDIKRLENFPHLRRLRTLLISTNRLQRIEKGLGKALPNLQVLIMQNNQIKDLGDLDALFELGKSLQYLSLVDNPVTDRQHYRLYLIHHLPRLRVLDFEKVKDKERIAAAKLFTGEQGEQLLKDLQAFKATPLTFEVGKLPGGKKKLTPEEVARIKDMVAKASSLEEVARLERQLRQEI